MKKSILLLFVSLMVFNAGVGESLEADESSCCYEDSCCLDTTNFYAKVFGGANFLQNTKIDENKATYETGYIVAGALGYRFCYGLSLEAEYAYRRNDIGEIHFFGEGSSKNGYIQTSSYMGNLLWDMPLSLWGCTFCNIQPFLGAGIGYDFDQMHSSNSRIIFNQDWHHFSWQLMAGVSYPFFCNTDVTLEYKYHQGSCHFYNHSIGVGLVYRFDFL